MMFFVGMDDVCNAWRVKRTFISINRLRGRIRGFPVNDWILDSGAFTTIERHGGYPDPPRLYAAHVRHWSRNGNMLAAISQDYMCEPFMVARTGLSVGEHQRLTIERYNALMGHDLAGAYLMPVIQGYEPDEYRRHLSAYDERLAEGAWVGVGTVCKRNANPVAVLGVLAAIHAERPDLRLHGFGLKTTALRNMAVRLHLHSADSMAWSFHARRNGGGAHDWRRAVEFERRIAGQQAA